MTESTDRVLIRMYLHFGDQFRKLCWFELKQGDLYWGSSGGKAKTIGSQTIDFNNDSRSVTVHVPSEVDHLPAVTTKYSYHKSGTAHHKTQYDSGEAEYDKPRVWRAKEALSKPTRFYILITRPLYTYTKSVAQPKHNASKNEYHIILGVEGDETMLKNRLYLEFYLVPPGDHPVPDTLFFGKSKLDHCVHMLNKDLSLAVIYHPMYMFEDRWPETEMQFIPDNV